MQVKTTSLPISLIAACSLNRVIGSNRKLPWTLPCDWSYFLSTVKGNILITGRKSYQELNVPIPQCYNIGISRTADDRNQFNMYPNMNWQSSIQNALADIKTNPQYAQCQRIFIGGGEDIFKEILSCYYELIDSCYITQVTKHITTVSKNNQAMHFNYLPVVQSQFPVLKYSRHTRLSTGMYLRFGIWGKK